MIIQLSAAQRSVIEPACAREELCIFPVTANLKGGAVGNVCRSLLKRGLVEEVTAADEHTIWRHGEDGTPLTLRATELARKAIAGEAPDPVLPPTARAKKPSTAPAAAERKVSRQDLLLSLLRRRTGATIAEMSEATGWQAHSVRGALSGIIGKKLSLKVVSEKVADRGRVYRIG
jgi:hypothetical protein